MDDAPDKTFLTIAETARLLRISERSAYKLAKAGELPGAAQYGVQWRVRRDVLMDWAAKQGTTPTNETKGG